jgi:hypothetical protein
LDSDEKLNVDILASTLDILWPAENKIADEQYEYLFNFLRHHGIHNQRQLSRVIEKYRRDVLERSTREAEWLLNAIKNNPIENQTITIRSPNKIHTIHVDVTPQSIERLEKGIFYGHVALTVTAIQFDSGERSPSDPID